MRASSDFILFYLKTQNPTHPFPLTGCSCILFLLLFSPLPRFGLEMIYPRTHVGFFFFFFSYFLYNFCVCVCRCKTSATARKKERKKEKNISFFLFQLKIITIISIMSYVRNVTWYISVVEIPQSPMTFFSHTHVCVCSRYLIYSIETKTKKKQNKIVNFFIYKEYKKKRREKKSWNLSPPEATHEKMTTRGRAGIN